MRPRCLLAAMLLLQLNVPIVLHAATRTWSGLTTNLSIAAWSDTNNWVGHVRPGTADDVLFPSTGQNRQNFNDLLTSLHSIVFADSGYIISGNTLTLTNGILATNTSGINVFSDDFSAPANFNLGANQSVTNLNAASTLALLTVDLEGKGLTIGGAGTNSIIGLKDSVGGGTFTNAGSGTFLFFGTNTSFTGPMALNAGTNLFLGFQQRSPITWTAGTLGGTGSLGNVTASGLTAKRLAPGYLGRLGILSTSNLVLNSAVTLAIHVNGTNLPTPTQAGDYDRILTRGPITLGSATLSLLFTNNLSPTIGTFFDLVTPLSSSDLITGQFAGLPDGSTITNNNVVYQLSYSSGHGVVLTVTNLLSTGVSNYWTGLGGDGLWSNTNNWQNHILPQQGDTILFEQGHISSSFIVTSNDLPPELTFDSIHFQTYQSSARTITVLGNSLRLSSGVFLESEAVGNQVFNNGTYNFSNHISLNNSQPFTNGLYANLHVAGGLDLGPSTLSLLAPLNNAGIGGLLFDSSITGPGVFESDGGAGTIQLNASNAITGSILVNRGTLNASHPQALGSASSGQVRVATNAVLNLPLANTTYTGSSIALTGALQTAASNVTLAAALDAFGSNSVLVVSNFSSLLTPSLSLLGPVTNSALLTFAAGFHAALQLPAGVVLRGGGLLSISKGTFNADGTIHNTVQLGRSSHASLSSAGQIDTLISTNSATISPGSALDTNQAFNPLQVGTLVMGSSNTTLAISLFPNRPGGGPTNTLLTVTNLPTLGNATLNINAQSTLAPNQQFTILRNLSGAPLTDTFTNLPEGAFLGASNGNLGLQITYAGGAGHDVVLTVQSNTPPFFPTGTNVCFFQELTNNFCATGISDFENDGPFKWELLTPIPGLSIITNGFLTGNLTWTPQEGQACSNYTVLFKATDNGTPPMSGTGTVIIVVQEINQPPVPVPVPNTNILAGHTLSIQLQANDPDIPAQPLTWIKISGPTNGSVTPDGLFTFAPSQSEFGTNSFAFKVSDSDPCAINSTSLSANLAFSVAVARNRIVTNTIDDPTTNVPGSLRWAITEIGTNPNGGHIEFNIDTNLFGPGPFKIAPIAALPPLGNNTYLDGYTQPGAQPNTNTIGTSATIMIELSGENLAVTGQQGLDASQGSAITIRGLCLNNFTNSNVAINSASCPGSDHCSHSGIAIEGCFIGTDISGTNARPNTQAIIFSCACSCRVGGPAPSQRNLISASLLDAVVIGGFNVANMIVQNNLIGTDRTGTNALGNSHDGLVMGGLSGTAGCIVADNVICANAEYGVNDNETSDLIVRNKIGVGADGQTPLGNGGDGLFLNGSGTGHLVGGTNAADANLIANNNGFGAHIFGQNITLLGNSIFRNTGRAIKVEPGANNGQSAPVLTSAGAGLGSLSVQGTLTSQSNTTYRIEFFHNPDFAPSNAPQAWIFLGATNVTTDSSSNANFSITFNQTFASGFLTATATDPSGNTSGISDGLALLLPVLNIGLLNGQARLFWLTNFTAFILQSNGSVIQPAGWGDVPGTPGVTGSNFFRDFSPATSRLFFRLRSQ